VLNTEHEIKFKKPKMPFNVFRCTESVCILNDASVRLCMTAKNGQVTLYFLKQKCIIHRLTLQISRSWCSRLEAERIPRIELLVITCIGAEFQKIIIKEIVKVKNTLNMPGI